MIGAPNQTGGPVLKAAKPALFVLVVAALLSADPPARAVDPVSVGVSAANTAAVIGQVGKMLDSMIAKAIEQADDAAAARLRQIATELKGILLKIQPIIDGTAKAANDVVDDALSDLHSIVFELRDITQATTGSLADTVNGALAQASGMLDAVPLVSVDPYLSSILPRRVRPDAGNPEVRVLGYFGELAASTPPIFYVNNTRVAGQRVPGGFRLTLPREGDKPLTDGYYDIRVDVAKNEPFLWFFKKQVVETWNEKLFVQRLRPYTCEYQPFATNPDSELRVKATTPFTDSARTSSNARRPSVNDSRTAEELLIQTVPNAVDLYDTWTARIVNPNASISGRAACQDHAGWSGQITKWDQTAVHYSLKAGDIGPHQHSGWKMRRVLFGKTKVPYAYIHGGGGSHADLTMSPEFIVSKKGVPPLVGLESVPFALKPNEGIKRALKLPAKNWAIHVRCQYDDGDPSFQTQLKPMILTPVDSAENARDMQARIENNVLYVTARN